MRAEQAKISTKRFIFVHLSCDSPEREAWDETVIVPSVRETIEAIRFYLKTYHQPGHPYVLLGHGQGALYIQEALKELEDEVLPSDGFVAAYLPNLPEVAFRQLGADFSEGNIRLARGKLDTGVVAAWRVGTGPVTNRQEDASNLVSAGVQPPLHPQWVIPPFPSSSPSTAACSDTERHATRHF